MFTIGALGPLSSVPGEALHACRLVKSLLNETHGVLTIGFGAMLRYPAGADLNPANRMSSARRPGSLVGVRSIPFNHHPVFHPDLRDRHVTPIAARPARSHLAPSRGNLGAPCRSARGFGLCGLVAGTRRHRDCRQGHSGFSRASRGSRRNSRPCWQIQRPKPSCAALPRKS